MKERTAALTTPLIDGTDIVLLSVTADSYDEAADAAWVLWSDPEVRDWVWRPSTTMPAPRPDEEEA